MKSFGSDNHSGVHPAILKAIADANVGHAASYGQDDWTERAVAIFKKHFGDVDVFFVFNGTAANVLALASMTESYHSILCSDLAHLTQDECGAPERFLGAKLITVPHEDGRVRIADLEKKLVRGGDQHFSQPRVLSLTQPTELGTVYSIAELRELCAFAREHHLLVHMDGSRLVNAAMRSPLAMILYALETLPDLSGGKPGRKRQACQIARRQAERAIRIIDDLDYARGSWAKLSLRKEVVVLAEVVARSIESAEHLIAERMHVMTVSLPRKAVILDADPMRLEQVLTNLLANAAKFTDPGGHIRLTVEEDEEIVVRIRDDGRGIEPDLLPRVFDLFLQGRDVDKRRSGGLGLGLALVKCLVELHDGSVAASSDGPGTGSEFVVRLPVRSRDAP